MAETLFLDPWRCSTAIGVANRRPLYICVSGNSGSGKSTLLRLLGQHIQDSLGNTIAIDENSLHHPFIDRLFHDPEAFSFEIQLNFMVQRCLVVKRWLAAGYNVIMERSHPEDLIFIRHLLAENLVTKQEHDAYTAMWEALAGRLRWPDLIVFFDLPSDISLQRLNEAEDTGLRPREFPNEALKKKWLESWQHLYKDRLRELQRDPSIPGPRLIVLSGGEDRATIPSAVFQAARELIAACSVSVTEEARAK
jgi:deoxyadenosine/deoxycytidine kinase